jgi:hypothetical protein
MEYCVKHRTKYILQINPTPPQLTAQLKIRKEDIPIRPVVHNTSSPTYLIHGAVSYLRR